MNDEQTNAILNLKKLKDAGALTEEEFQKKKKEILEFKMILEEVLPFTFPIKK